MKFCVTEVKISVLWYQKNLFERKRPLYKWVLKGEEGKKISNNVFKYSHKSI